MEENSISFPFFFSVNFDPLKSKISINFISYLKLFSPHFQPNEAGQKYLQMRREWRTELSDIQPEEVTSNNCIFRFRTFHGLHRITVNLPDGSVLEQNVEISNNPGELVLVFNKQNSDDESEPD